MATVDFEIALDRDGAVPPRVLSKRIGAEPFAICARLGTSAHFEFVNITGCRAYQLATVSALRRSRFVTRRPTVEYRRRVSA